MSELSIVHGLEGAPRPAAQLRGDWGSPGAGGHRARVLRDLTSLLETASRLAG